jgi:RecB family exonuclease
VTELLARPRRSYSRLDTWQQCPQAYKAKYVDKLPEEPSVWSVGGTAFHTVAEQILLGRVDPLDEAQLFPAWLEAFRSAYDDVVNHRRFAGDRNMATWRKANRGVEDQDWWVSEGYRMVQRFGRWRTSTGAGLGVLTVGGRPGLEAEIEVELGGVPVIAIPDWCAVDEHGQVCVVDYKTGKPPKKPTQLRFYAAVLAEKYELHAAWGLYYMARPGQLLAHDLTRTDPDELIAQLVDFDTRERAGDYELPPGQECQAYQCPTHPRSKRR